MVQGGVSPSQILRIGQGIESCDVLLGYLLGRFLIVRITVVNAATERTRLAGGAELVLLKGTKLGRHGLFVFRSVGEQHLGFEIAEKKRVAPFRKPAAAAAGDA